MGNPLLNSNGLCEVVSRSPFRFVASIAGASTDGSTQSGIEPRKGNLEPSEIVVGKIYLIGPR
jgi:hypothetical protein